MEKMANDTRATQIHAKAHIVINRIKDIFKGVLCAYVVVTAVRKTPKCRTFRGYRDLKSRLTR